MSKENKEQQQLFQLLRDIEAKNIVHNVLPAADTDIKEEWSGVSFVTAGLHFVARMGDILEVLTYPELTRVPRSKTWVKGVANVRGNLLPIMDLKDFLGGGRTSVHRRSRVLVVEYNSSATGLLVDDSMGIKRFYSEERKTAPESIDEMFKPYVDGVFIEEVGLEEFEWNIFNIEVLMQEQSFYRAAV
ncbi:MAG: purine-binding chemotaxis protein CheW [Gammaproteobacteria bacterium]|nr:MAG: purine-binding chemotaxis protein CheW [Gammaproteobacteria bacterium]